MHRICLFRWIYCFEIASSNTAMQFLYFSISSFFAEVQVSPAFLFWHQEPVSRPPAISPSQCPLQIVPVSAILLPSHSASHLKIPLPFAIPSSTIPGSLIILSLAAPSLMPEHFPVLIHQSAARHAMQGKAI
jgi:hypothetical protein